MNEEAKTRKWVVKARRRRRRRIINCSIGSVIN
jgi:hypothetical protein